MKGRTLFDKNGQALWGGRIYADKPTLFADKEMTIPHCNPIVCDAYGRLPDIYFSAPTHLRILDVDGKEQYVTTSKDLELTKEQL